MAGDTTITVVGNLTADAELRFTPSGAAVANFTVASTPRIYDRQSGEWKDGEALFLRCNIWREAAENVAESLTRGARVIVTGRLKQRSFDTREGEKRTVVEVEVDEIGPSLRYATAKVNKASRSGGGGGGGGFGGGGGSRQQSAPASSAPADDPWGSAPASGSFGGGDDEIYKANPNVMAVVYAQTPEIVAFTKGVPMHSVVNGAAFIGAAPYRKAKDRGVKLIGATSHYVTKDLDEGPIIEQDVARVDHSMTAGDLQARGAYVERAVLSRAVQWHAEDRVIRHGNSTIVF